MSKPCRVKVLALYKFVQIPNDELEELQKEVDGRLRNGDARGTILLAKEGINGTICYPHSNEGDGIIDYLQNHRYFMGLRTRTSFVDSFIFHRLKVKLKKEIVTIGGDNDGPNEYLEPVGEMVSCAVDPCKIVGNYVKPGKEWDDLLDDPNVVVIDTRNKYEIEIGTFENAISPNTDNFRQFPDWLHRFAKACEAAESNSSDTNERCVLNSQKVNLDFEKERSIYFDNMNARNLEPVPDDEMPIVKKKPKAVAMFCTGGIRCEKSTSYTIAAKVFPPDIPIYHLDGGVLAYLDSHPDGKQSKWKGECFVFDQRVAVTHGLQPSSTYTACHACRRPITKADMERDDYVKGISCKHCKDGATEEQKLRFKERQKQIELAEKKGMKHIHDAKEESCNKIRGY